MSWQETLKSEIAGLSLLGVALGRNANFPRAVDAMLTASKVAVTGMGKSGCVARKVAGTFCSTGTPAYYLHPADAAHGDLGLVTSDDVMLAFSWSGETPELNAVVYHSKRFKVPLIVVTSEPTSTIARVADILLDLPKAPEGCPLGIAPTTSAIMQQATGDCLAMALLEARGFTREDFHALHPGGRLGTKLITVGEVMHTGDEMPLVPTTEPVRYAIVEMSKKLMGCVGVYGEEVTLDGIITDGDLRRHIEDDDLLSRKVDDIMTRDPKVVKPETLAAEALEIMNAHEISALFVIAHNRPIGIVHLHDLLRHGVA
jgi:arabinose-5-phosphate isomerase